jgi:hypothetical protein
MSDKKRVRYYVIGGQYQAYCYGGATTMAEAKKIADEHEEYWDNWAGWHKPCIYRAQDTEPCVNFYGEGRCPLPWALPVGVRV